jgi:hypothetical protein
MTDKRLITIEDYCDGVESALTIMLDAAETFMRAAKMLEERPDRVETWAPKYRAHLMGEAINIVMDDILMPLCDIMGAYEAQRIIEKWLNDGTAQA